MTEHSYDCLCAGIVVADHVCEPIDHMPAAGELILTPRMELTIGGCASNVALDLAKLGVNVGLAGMVGADLFGEFVRRTLTSAGVDCRCLGVSETLETGGSLIVSVADEDRRFVTSVGANADFTGREVTPELIQSARILYLGGYCFCDSLAAEYVATMFETARSYGVTTILDVVIPSPSDYWPLLEPVLPLTDLFLPNNDEGRLITGLDDPFAQAVEFRACGAKTVVVTCGGEGAVLVGETERIRVGSFPVEVVDGTGSGDAFVAGYIHALLSGRSVEECLRSGTALGASSVCATGATTGIFTADELQAFLAEHTLPVTRL